MDSQILWQTILTELEVTLSRANFNMWFRDTFIAEDTGEVVIIGVPNAFYLDWIRSKYHKNIAEAMRKQRPTIREITYKVISKPVTANVHARAELFSTPPNPMQTWSPPTLKATVAPTVEQPTINGLPVSTQTGHTPLDPSRVFDNFVVGNSNRLAHAVSLAAASEPGKKYNPLFIYGGAGLGKTHLAQAIGNEIKRHSPAIKITYVSCEVFTNEFIESVRKNQMDSFRRRYRMTEVLLIDDIQFMSGKEGTQEEFFHTFNALHQNKKQIVLTADQEPQKIPDLEERLTSRFAWGMVADIQPPDLETRIAILRAKCTERQYSLPNETIEALAQLVQSNIRELEGALQRLMTQAQIEQQAPTPDYVAKVFSGSVLTARGRSVNANRIIQTVSEFFELKTDEVIGSRRYKEYVYPRQLVMYLLRHELSFSYPKIGKELGGKDHTTIMHGVEKIEKEIARNANIQYDLTKLKEKIYQNM